LPRQIDELQARLAEADETLRAIREGEVDAVVVCGSKGEQIYSLVGTDSIYRLIVQTMRETALTVSLDGTILFCNARFGEFLKRPLERIVGHSLREFVAENNQESASRLLMATRAQPVKLRMVFQSADGAAVPAHVSAIALDQPDGVSICAVATDLTELENSTELIQQLRRQQESLRESELRYKTVADNTHDFEFWIDPEGRCLYASPSCRRIYAREPAEFLADPALRRAVVHPEDRSAFDRHVAMEQERLGGDVEYRGVRADGSYCWISHVCQPVFDESGNYLGVRGSNRDVTDRREAEEALQQVNANLERNVEERTAELTQRASQLRALAAELTLSEQRERRRLANVLHDHLQQLLVAARFRVSMLSRGADTQLMAAVTEIDGLLSESLKTSRSLTAELSPPILHEGGLSSGLSWLARWMADKHGLVVDLVMEENAPGLPEDVKLLLFESIRELLFNTVKHAGVPSARVQVQTADGQLHIVVSDEGAGFDPEHLKLAGTSGGKFGLLSIVERLELIGGKLAIESAPGRGSRFAIALPVGPVVCVPAAAGLSPQSRPG
jgi:PAS domain S-box-containing protein